MIIPHDSSTGLPGRVNTMREINRMEPPISEFPTIVPT
jgi:hypothetical protein